MFFGDYKSHSEAQVRKSLLWEYDLDKFDWPLMRNIVVQRVVERGRMDDFYAVLNIYGEQGVQEAIKKIPFLNQKDMSFVCAVFDLKKEELECYTRTKAITYFDDINFHEPIKMSDGVALNWKKIEKRLINIQKEPNRIFQSVP